MKLDTNVPLCLFFYNRPQFVYSCFEALNKNKGITKTPIYVFIDGPKSEDDRKKVDETYNNILELDKSFFLSIHIYKSERNIGLATSIIKGVSQVLHDYDSVIVLEDDLVVSSNFINYMNQSLSFYKSNKDVGSISGFGFNVNKKSESENFFHHRPTSWGWATWRDRWDKAIWDLSKESEITRADFKKLFNRGGQDLYRMLKAYLDNKIDSWAIRWAYTHYKYNWKASCPYLSKVINYGYGDEATNCKTENPFKINFDTSEKTSFELLENVYLDPSIVKEMNWFNSNLYRLVSKIKLSLNLE